MNSSHKFQTPAYTGVDIMLILEHTQQKLPHGWGSFRLAKWTVVYFS